MSPSFERFVRRLERWCAATTAIIAAGIAGSHARGEAREDSDIDVIVLCLQPATLLEDRAWLSRFGEPVTVARERWGVMTALRVFYADGQEIEFGINPVFWADLPAEPGTRRVVEDGLRIVYDPRRVLRDLQRAVAS